MDQDRAAPNLPSADPASVRTRLDGLRQKTLFRIAAARAETAHGSAAQVDHSDPAAPTDG